MHQLVAELALGFRPKKVDHRNNNGLDNQRCNLRLASHRQNLCNRPANKNNKCEFKGVHKLAYGRFRALINVPERKHLGCFDTAEEAARAYDKAALCYFKEFAWLNFPQEN